MRIVIDLQACQSTGSRHRGIGRYSLALVKAMAKYASHHEIHLLLNAHFDDSIQVLRDEFKELIPHQYIHIWESLEKVAEHVQENHLRCRVSEMIREQALAELKPDFILLTSLFEGYIDDAITSISQNREPIPTAVILYDLIPLIHAQQYLQDPQISDWYYRKTQALKRADLLLSISDSSRQEGTDWLNIPSENIVNMSSAIDERFCYQELSDEYINQLKSRHQLIRSYIMYTGGIDLRKNIEGLIRAYSQLPEEVRQQYQLAIVCSIQESDRVRLLTLAKQVGLKQGDVVLTGFVPDEDLPALYQNCQLFVFPSWHEGFGLPALEAMSCGAPVIASNTSSLPEVIGNQDALFDPHNESDISVTMLKALTDQAYSKQLREMGLEQAKKFSWEKTAKSALAAIEKKYHGIKQQQVHGQFNFQKPRLAYFSPIPPVQSGIADYSAELLPELDKYYQVTIIVDQIEVPNVILKSNFQIRDLDWFEENADLFDRIMYHIGNSPFHAHMFDMLEKYPGVVVLHDFYISNIHSHLDFTGQKKGGWVKALYESHGYSALLENAQEKDVHQIIWKYPCNFAVIKNAIGIIVHSEFSKNLAHQWLGKDVANSWKKIPHLRKIPAKQSREKARKILDIQPEDFLVCAFGMLGPTKLNHQLLRVWLNSELATNQHCHLVFVGQNDAGQYGEELTKIIAEHQLASSVKITGFADVDLFSQYLQAADVGIQLRTLSRGETSGTVLDCMAHGLATIVNSNGSMAELPESVVFKIEDQFTDEDLQHAMLALWKNSHLRKQYSDNARNHIAQFHAPTEIGMQYAEVIESIYQYSPLSKQSRLLQSIKQLDEKKELSQAEIMIMAKAIAANKKSIKQKRLLIDITVLAQVDNKSGIQRVVRSILSSLLKNPPNGYRVEPIILTPQGIQFARTFVCDIFNLPKLEIGNDLVECNNEDIFLGLDLNCGSVIESSNTLMQLKKRGVLIYFVVYDLLPILMPDYFNDELVNAFKKWYEVIVDVSHGAICISHAVAEDFHKMLIQNQSKEINNLKIGAFHLGADIASSLPSVSGSQLPIELQTALIQKKCFLMVGTVEPRKGHMQTLIAFEQLWVQQIDVCLIIVGSRGWKTEGLVDKLLTHSEKNKRLFFLEKCGDDSLSQLYQSASALIMSSIGEGFGLPLIEAAHYKLPVIARNLPVFKEVAKENAFYFQGSKSDDLSLAILTWLNMYETKKHPKSENMNFLSWNQSAQQLCDVFLNDKWNFLSSHK